MLLGVTDEEMNIIVDILKNYASKLFVLFVWLKGERWL